MNEENLPHDRRGESQIFAVAEHARGHEIGRGDRQQAGAGEIDEEVIHRGSEGVNRPQKREDHLPHKWRMEQRPDRQRGDEKKQDAPAPSAAQAEAPAVRERSRRMAPPCKTK